MISRRMTPHRPERRYITAVAVVGLLASALLAGGTALAVHDTGRFQLDGDAASGTNTAVTPAASDDWDKVCYTEVQEAVADGGEGLTAAQAALRCGINTGPTNATSTAWTAEPDTSASIFTGGGSKDPIDVTSWAWKDAGGLPDKDNLLHGFAARYSLTPSATCPADVFPTCELLYFGSDRYDNSGDAQQGVWFFQSKITTAGAKVGGGTGFTGKHRTGDVLVISDFSNGGTVSTIKVFKWQPICTATNKSSDTGTVPNGACADANLQSLFSSDAANCTTVQGAGDQACGLVNPSTVVMPWSFTDKSGTANNGALNGELYEGGINLSTLGLAGECFSSVVLETRSSTSTTAVLKDFILGQLGSCAPGMTTQVINGAGDTENGEVTPGTPVRDTATITITGAQAPADPTGTVTFFLCGPLTGGATGCATGGTNIGTGTLNGGSNTSDGVATATSPTVNDSGQTGVRGSLLPGRYCFRATWPGDSNYDPSSHSNNDTECFTVAKLPSTTATGSSTQASNVVPGTSVTDTATVTPTNAGGPTPTGTVDFFLCQPSEVTAGGCEGTAGTKIGATKTLNSSGQATSDATTNTTAIGKYCWRAEYSGSNTYLSSTHTNTTTECFTTVKQPSQTATTSNPTGTVNNGLGSTATDTATVTPVTSGQPTPTGTVTFFLCSPSEVTAGGCEGTAGTQVGAAKTLNSSGQATSDASGALNTLGKYCWRAEYSGDGFYLSSSHTNATTECFTIRTSSSGTSAQRWLPNDRIVVTSVGQSLAGTITVELRSGSCTGSVVYTDASGAAFTATTAGAVYQTSNTTYFIGTNADGTAGGAAGTYFWSVTFTPTSTLADGFTKCETSTLTINNNPSSLAPPSSVEEAPANAGASSFCPPTGSSGSVQGGSAARVPASGHVEVGAAACSCVLHGLTARPVLGSGVCSRSDAVMHRREPRGWHEYSWSRRKRRGPAMAGPLCLIGALGTMPRR
jgi:hypothetical protein